MVLSPSGDRKMHAEGVGYGYRDELESRRQSPGKGDLMDWYLGAGGMAVLFSGHCEHRISALRLSLWG